MHELYYQNKQKTNQVIDDVVVKTVVKYMDAKISLEDIDRCNKKSRPRKNK